MLNRADYKAIKGMDRAAMSAYLHKIYQRGYIAGRAAEKAAPAPVKRTLIEKAKEEACGGVVNNEQVGSPQP